MERFWGFRGVWRGFGGLEGFGEVLGELFWVFQKAVRVFGSSEKVQERLKRFLKLLKMFSKRFLGFWKDLGKAFLVFEEFRVFFLFF